MNRQAFKKKVNRSGPTSKGSRGNILVGYKIIPSDEPPVLTGQPWNGITLDTDMEINANTFTSFTTEKLWEALVNQAGFAKLNINIPFEIRIESIQVWGYEKNMTTGNLTFERFSFCPFNYIGGTGIEMTRLESNSMRNKFAKAGYRYPSTISSVPFFIDTGVKVAVFSVASSVASKVIIHIRMYWRGANAGFKINVPTNSYKYITMQSSKHKSELEPEEILESACSIESLEIVSREAMELKAFGKPNSCEPIFRSTS